MNGSALRATALFTLLALTGLGCTGSGRRSWNPLSQVVPRRYSAATELKIARIHEQQGNLAKARELYQKRHRDDPNDVEVIHRLAIVAARMGNHEDADRHFQQALSLEPNNPQLLGDYGYAKLLQKDYSNAEATLRRALTLAPGDKRVINNLAMAVGYQGRHDQALAMFRRVVPEAQAQANLGFIHAQRGEGRRAVERYSRAIALDKNLRSASHALVQLAELEQKYLQTERGQRRIARIKSKRTGIPLRDSDTVAEPPTPQPQSQVRLIGGENESATDNPFPRTTTNDRPQKPAAQADHSWLKEEDVPNLPERRTSPPAQPASASTENDEPAWSESGANGHPLTEGHGNSPDSVTPFPTAVDKQATQTVTEEPQTPSPETPPRAGRWQQSTKARIDGSADRTEGLSSRPPHPLKSPFDSPDVQPTTPEEDWQSGAQPSAGRVKLTPAIPQSRRDSIRLQPAGRRRRPDTAPRTPATDNAPVARVRLAPTG